MDRGVHQHEVGSALAEPANRGEFAIGGAFVDEPEDAPCLATGLLHSLADQAIKGGDAGLALAAAEQRRAM